MNSEQWDFAEISLDSFAIDNPLESDIIYISKQECGGLYSCIAQQHPDDIGFEGRPHMSSVYTAKYLNWCAVQSDGRVLVVARKNIETGEIECNYVGIKTYRGTESNRKNVSGTRGSQPIRQGGGIRTGYRESSQKGNADNRREQERIRENTESRNSTNARKRYNKSKTDVGIDVRFSYPDSNDENYGDTLMRMYEGGGSSFFVSGVNFGRYTNAKNQVYTSKGKQLRTEISIQELLNQAKRLDKKSDANKLASRLNVNNVTDKQFGELYYAVSQEIYRLTNETVMDVRDSIVSVEGLSNKAALKYATQAVSIATGVSQLSDKGKAYVKNNQVLSDAIDLATELCNEKGIGKSIDNQQNSEYNKKRGESNERTDKQSFERTDEFRSLQAEVQGMSANDTSLYRTGERKVDEGIRKRLSRSIRGLLLDTRDNGPGNGNGILTLNAETSGNQFNIYQNVTGGLFHDAFEIARSYLKNGDLL